MGIDAVKAALEPEPAWPVPAETVVNPRNGPAAQGIVESMHARGPSSTGAQYRRSADGLFHLNASVNGKPVRFVLDTGSSVVVLTRADAQALGINPTRREFDNVVQTASGNAPIAWTTLDHVRVGDRHARRVSAIVVQDGLPISLLGQNVISQLGSVTIDGDRLKLY